MSNINQFNNEQTFIFDYDVSSGEHSGNILTAGHALGQLPANFIITQAWIDVLTTFTSSGDNATISLGYTGALGAFEAAIAIDDGTDVWDSAIPRVSDVAADGAVGNFVTAAGGDTIFAVVAVETVTAGRTLLVIKGYVAA